MVGFVIYCVLKLCMFLVIPRRKSTYSCLKTAFEIRFQIRLVSRCWKKAVFCANCWPQVKLLSLSEVSQVCSLLQQNRPKKVACILQLPFLWKSKFVIKFSNNLFIIFGALLWCWSPNQSSIYDLLASCFNLNNWHWIYNLIILFN